MARTYQLSNSSSSQDSSTASTAIIQDNQQVKQDSIARSVFLHLFPGAMLTAAFVVTAPLALTSGFPAIAALLICVAVLLIPFALGHLFYEGKRRNGYYSLKGIVLLQQRTPLRRVLLIVPLVTLWSFAVYILMTPLEGILVKTIFAWLPVWYIQPDLAHYPKTVLLITFGLDFVINGVAAPVVEELYFRGYLLPRLSRFGRWAPIINLALFSLYHFWQPQQNITNLIALLPFVYIVWKRQDVRLSMLLHCTLNIIGIALTCALYLGHP
ncbi:MAG: CPBP family intramembrane glutamic endopeptidase [Ktedonobacteraceae bacterium]